MLWRPWNEPPRPQVPRLSNLRPVVVKQTREDWQFTRSEAPTPASGHKTSYHSSILESATRPPPPLRLARGQNKHPSRRVSPAASGPPRPAELASAGAAAGRSPGWTGCWAFPMGSPRLATLQGLNVLVAFAWVEPR